MDNNERKCPMDCSKCSFRQNVYCASQIALANNEKLNAILGMMTSNEEVLKSIVEHLEIMAGKMETLQADALLIDPMAQFRAAAQKVDSQERQTKED